jgi:hypothetical protein
MAFQKSKHLGNITFDLQIYDEQSNKNDTHDHINNFKTRKPKNIHSITKKYLENPKTKR